MPAAATDLLQEVGINTATTLDAPGYTIGGTSVTVVSTSNWPTATGITFAMDEVDANGDQVAGSYNEYVGTVASATSITNVSHQNGTDQDYSAGTTTRVYIPVSAERENRIVEWGIVEHNQDGTHDEAIINSRTSKATPTTSDLVLIADAAASNVLKKATLGNIVPADSITASKIDWASTGADGGIWWEELGRTTLGVAGDTITIASFGARKYLKILITTLDTGGTTGSNIQFNNDSGANYASRYSANGAADTTAVSQTSCLVHGSLNASPMVSEITIYNVAADEKVFSFHASNAGTAGAGNAPNRVEGTGKWSNTSDQITRVDVVNAGTGDFAIGSSVVVLGHD